MSNNIQGKRIGFIGAGRIGRPIIQALLGAGYSVAVYDKHKPAADSVIACGATWATSSKSAAKGADAVITCLARPEHVSECMLGEHGALAGMSEGSTWVNTSTTDYHSSIKIAEEARKNGVWCIEGPVSNISHMGVDFGNSSIYCAGDEAGYLATKDMLETVTKISFFTGDIGSAQAVKLLTNLIFYGSVSICGDCLAISQQAGIPSHWMWDRIRTSKANSVAAEQFIPMLLDGSYDNSCSLEIGVKDMALTVAMADEQNVDLPLCQVVNNRYAEAGKVFDQQFNHMFVSKLTEDANNMLIRILDFSAPSKYGADAGYDRGDEVVIDRFGKATPKLPAHYRAPSFTPSPLQQGLVNALIQFMAYTNGVLNSEAVALGKSAGLDETQLEKMIIWSVGSNWVLENSDTCGFPNELRTRLHKASSGMKLPYIDAILAALPSG